MPDIDLNGQGVQQNFSFQDTLPFRLIFTKGSPFPENSCAFIRFQYAASDPRLPKDELRWRVDCATGGEIRSGRSTREILNNIWDGARLPSSFKQVLYDSRGRLNGYTFWGTYQKHNIPWSAGGLVETPGAVKYYGFELNTSTSNGGLFTIDKANGNIILDYPSEMTQPKYISPFGAEYNFAAEKDIPLTEGDCSIPVVRTVVDIRSFCFTTAKYELFVLTTENGIKRVSRPLYGNMTRMNLFIGGQTAPSTCP